MMVIVVLFGIIVIVVNLFVIIVESFCYMFGYGILEVVMMLVG